MELPEKCPGCGAASYRDVAGHRTYECRSNLLEDGDLLQTQRCLSTERDNLIATNAIYRKALEAIVKQQFRDGQIYDDPRVSSVVAAEAIRLADAEREAGKDGGA